MSIFSALTEPEKVTVTVPEVGVPTQEYNRLASKLGVKADNDFQRQRHEFMKFMSEEMIQVYPLASVHRYMVKMAKKAGKNYVWKPARAVDYEYIATRYNSLPDNYPGDDKTGTVPFRGLLRTSSVDVYQQPIPYPVLKTMETFQDKFAKDVVMLITDYEVVHPDPFLGIYHIPTRTFVVVEKWNEPSYRMED